MNHLCQVTELIKTLEEVAELMQNGLYAIEELEDLKMAVMEINKQLYHAEILKFQNAFQDINTHEYNELLEELELLIRTWQNTLEVRLAGNSIDAEFWEIYETFKYVDEKVIYQKVVQHFLDLPKALQNLFVSLPAYSFLHNRINYLENDFSLIKQHVTLMSKEAETYKWLYEHLADNRSRVVLNGVIRFWFEFDLKHLESLYETVFQDYFDLDILECGADDVMVDLGAFTGDSILDYLKTYQKYKKIYAYEITPVTYDTLVENMSGYPDIITVNKGVSDKSGTMYLDSRDQGEGNKLLEQGDMEIEVVALDDDIKEPVSVIKMDIEGAEKAAIAGAKHHIENEKPKLLISAYHLPEDIFEIPKLVHSIRKDYTFYLRFYGRDHIWPCDYVLFAI